MVQCRGILRTLSLTLALAAAAGADTCDNQVYSDLSRFSKGNWDKLSKIVPATAPALVPSNATICTSFGGKQGCCSSETLVAAQAAFDEASAMVAAMKTGDDFGQYTASLEETLLPLALNVCQLQGAKADACIAAVTRAADTHLPAIVNAVASMQADLANCASGLLGYAMGMVCFVCEPHADEFLELGPTGPESVHISQATCDGVFGACSPLMGSSHSVLLAATQLVAAIASAVAGVPIPLPAGIDPGNMHDLCGGSSSAGASPADCKQMVCDTVLDGFSIPLLDSSVSSAALATHAGHSLSATLAAAGLTPAAGLATDAFDPKAAPFGFRAAAAEASGHNQYQASGGFDAYAVGCSDVNCPSAWPTYLIASGGAILVAGAAAVAYRQKRVRTAKDEALLPAEGADYANLARVDM